MDKKAFFRKLNSPTSVQIEITELCNSNCIHCYNFWRKENSGKRTLSYYEIDLIVAELLKNGIFSVVVTGGEPLLFKKKAFYLIKKLANEGVRVSLNTNATLLDFSTAKTLKEIGLSSILVSLPSFRKESYEKIAGRDSFSEMILGIENAIQQKIPISVNMVLNKINIGEIFQTAEFAQKMGIKSFAATKASPPAGIDIKRATNIFIDKQEFELSLHQLAAISRNLKMNINALECYPLCSIPNLSELSPLAKHKCLAGITGCTIGSNGGVRPCSHSHMEYGNIIVEPLAEIWKKMEEWRNGEKIPDLCKKCKMLPNCSGGCRMEAYTRTGDICGVDFWAKPNNKDFSNLIPKKKLVDFASEEVFSVNIKLKSRKEKGFFILSAKKTIMVSNNVAEFLLAKKGSEFVMKEFEEIMNTDINIVRKTLSTLILCKIIFKKKGGD